MEMRFLEEQEQNEIGDGEAGAGGGILTGTFLFFSLVLYTNPGRMEVSTG